jgi:hypothetical protein
MANAIYTIYLAIRIADGDNCPQNLASFGVQTNIKSILLTLILVWDGSSRLELPPQWCVGVNGIDLIFVCTPKVAKFCGQIGVRGAAATK